MPKKKEYVEFTIMQEKETPFVKGAKRPPLIPKTVRVSKKVYRNLQKEFGYYFNPTTHWHFVDADTIKYWNGVQWKYKHVAGKLEKVL